MAAPVYFFFFCSSNPGFTRLIAARVIWSHFPNFYYYFFFFRRVIVPNHFADYARALKEMENDSVFELSLSALSIGAVEYHPLGNCSLES